MSRPQVLISTICLFALPLLAQVADSERPIPVLTGNAGFITTSENGETTLTPQINPVLLLPLGDHWLIESRAEFEGELERPAGASGFDGDFNKELDYLQVDYIANPYLTVTVGRFLTPFGMYNERLYPIWIRDLQQVPLIFPIGTGSSDGLMLRGGFSLNSKVNLNYASYFSTLSTNDTLDSDRNIGGRIGLFFPGPRVEAGVSWQKSLQEDRKNSFGFHFAWQPPRVPMNIRSEYARSDDGSGYWIESAYRLSQIPVWNHVMRRTELVARMQQFFKGENTAPGGPDNEYNLPFGNVQQPDLGLNYYIHDGLKVSGSYGRWFGHKDWNTWEMGIAYRFALPLGREQ
ncbi:MAG TPA: hypothetical protein VN684_09335 [Terriglobales bacterium]|nr:hypothetical protein [Terriglobales bacterium]